MEDFQCASFATDLRFAMRAVPDRARPPTDQSETPAMLQKSDVNRPLLAVAGLLGAAGVALAARAS